MAQLGSGAGSSYPASVDGRQIFQNGSPIGPDSPTRVDAEVLNDSLTAIVNMETTLGANVHGTFASLAARLNQFIPEGSLNLQAGVDERVTVRDSLGTAVVTMNTQLDRVGIGTTAPTHQLHLTADSALKPGTNTWTVASDARLKEVTGAYTDGLALLLQLAPVWYVYTGQGGIQPSPQPQVGLLAQALQPLAPYMVRSYRGRLTPESEETDLLTYEGHAMTFALINAVKELSARVEALETANSALHEQLARPPTKEGPC